MVLIRGPQHHQHHKLAESAVESSLRSSSRSTTITEDSALFNSIALPYQRQDFHPKLDHILGFGHSKTISRETNILQSAELGLFQQPLETLRRPFRSTYSALLENISR